MAGAASWDPKEGRLLIDINLNSVTGIQLAGLIKSLLYPKIEMILKQD
jgi:hypothetical protein